MQQGDLKDVHPSLNPEVSHPKIGVIDWGCSGTLAESDMQYFKREGKKIHLEEGKIYFREGKKIYCMSKKRYEAFLTPPKKYPIYLNGVDISISRVPEDDDELIEWWLAKQRNLCMLTVEDESNKLEDESNRLVIYGVIVDDEKVIVEKCLELLKRIDRESQFIACSVEEPSVFYAEMNKDDATRLKASDGIRVFQYGGLILF